MTKVLRIAVLLAGLASAQSFEVASIHPHVGPLRRTGRSVSGPNVTVEANSVLNIITDAYQLKDYQVDGVDGWVRLDRFDIAARSEGEAAPTTSQIRLMLQSLLAERFQFKFHRAAKEVPVYAVVIGKGASKLKEATRPHDGEDGEEGQDSLFTFAGATLADLAELLTQFPGVDRPVLNKTGFNEERYDFHLHLAPFRLRMVPDPAASPVTGPSGESLFTAIEEQLGLKLESQKNPVEILVIDRVERPSEN